MKRNVNSRDVIYAEHSNDVLVKIQPTVQQYLLALVALI